MLTTFSVQWFTAYYLSLGTLLFCYGFYLIAKQHKVAARLVEMASTYEEAPQVFRSVLKYLLLFTLPGLILSFYPFSWIELIFTIWSLIIIFTTGQMLLQWPVMARQILSVKGALHKKVRFAGINMVSIGVVLFMLCFILISKSS